MQSVTAVIRTAIRVEGIVQGVGFRPFVYTLATGLGLAGHVGNDVDGVFVEVEGAPAAVSEFLVLLERDAPPLARIERITTAPLPPSGSASFAIAASGSAGPRRTLVSADTATCADCLRELADSGRPAVRVPVHQLHQLRAQVHHRAGRALRPAADHDGGVRDVRAVRRGIPRPRRPPLPRAADLLPGLRAPARAA